MSITPATVVSLRPTTEDSSPSINSARVTESASGGELRDVNISLNGQVFATKVSFSCLVQPEVNDKVLVAGDGNGDYYIISILERPGAQNMTLALPGATSILNLQGSLDIQSSQGASVTAPKISLISEQSIHKSKQAYIDIDNLVAKGHDAQISFSTVKVISTLINTMAKQAIQKFYGYIRHTESADQVKAGQMSRTVEGLYSMDTKHTIMVSQKDTKIDGEHIHMG